MPSLPLRSPIPASFPFAVHSALRPRVLGSGGKSPNADPSQGRWGLECCSLSPLSAPGFLCASRRQHRGGAGTALAPREPQTGPPCAHLPGFPSPPPLTPSQWLPAPLPRTPYFRPATPPSCYSVLWASSRATQNPSPFPLDWDSTTLSNPLECSSLIFGHLFHIQPFGREFLCTDSFLGARKGKFMARIVPLPQTLTMADITNQSQASFLGACVWSQNPQQRTSASSYQGIPVGMQTETCQHPCAGTTVLATYLPQIFHSCHVLCA